MDTGSLSYNFAIASGFVLILLLQKALIPLYDFLKKNKVYEKMHQMSSLEWDCERNLSAIQNLKECL